MAPSVSWCWAFTAFPQRTVFNVDDSAGQVKRHNPPTNQAARKPNVDQEAQTRNSDCSERSLKWKKTRVSKLTIDGSSL